MIKITRCDNTITITGHTIPNVCAAVSTLMYATVNFLSKYDESSFIFEDNVEQDYVRIELLRVDNIIDMLIENMFDLLEDLVEDGNEDKVVIIG